jgi:hypothetical protein
METHESQQQRYPDNLFGCIERLGQAAVHEFLDELAPHLRAVTEGEDPKAGEHLNQFLVECWISASVIHRAGGLDGMHAKAQAALAGPEMSEEEFRHRLEKLGAL